MAKLREVLANREQDDFVDRSRELALFSEWLQRPGAESPILSVSGAGGVGKTFLLRAFGEKARSEGREVLYGDARTFTAVPEELARALVPGSRPAEVIEFLNQRKPILMLDTFEELSPLSRWLQEDFLPELEDEVRVVFSGRPELGEDWVEWKPLVHQVALEGFGRSDAREYLSRRGVDGVLTDQIIGAAGGHPLALALAADLATRAGLRDFGSSPEWSVTLRRLVQNMLSDVRQKELRSILEAAAVVRQFDEELLAHLVSLDDVHEAFSQLCRFSFVRSSRNGLMLHDDVRRLLLEDMKWREPDRVIGLRNRAQLYYRGRMRNAAPGQFDWYVAERLYLWENNLFQTLYFPEIDPAAVWVEPARTSDHDQLMKLHASFFRDPSAVPATPPEEEASGEFLSNMLGSPPVEISVARDRQGSVLGFGMMVRIAKDSLALLPDRGAIRTLVERAVLPARPAGLPTSWRESDVTYMGTIVPSQADTGEALGALGQYGMKVMGNGGIFLAATSEPLFSTTLESLGFVKFPDIGASSKPREPVDGWMIDLSLIGASGWLDAVMSGRRPPSLGLDELPAVVKAVLVGWGDETILAESPLEIIAGVIDPASDVRGAEAVRRLIQEALDRALASAARGDEIALRAVQLAYLEASVPLERVAEHMAVSRATFFRLLKRGTEHIARVIRQLVAEAGSVPRSWPMIT